MKYKYLLFDADNTLLDFDKAEHDALTKAFCEFGIPLTDELRSEYIAINKSLWRMHERGEIEREAIMYTRFNRLFEKIGFTLDGREAEKIYRRHLNEGSDVMCYATELLQTLSHTREVYIITNGSLETQIKRLSASGLAPYIRQSFVSEEVGYQKPTKAFFDYVKVHIDGFDEREALVIGDSLTSDILGGINAGIDTCLFDYNSAYIPGDIAPTYVIHALPELLALV